LHKILNTILITTIGMISTGCTSLDPSNTDSTPKYSSLEFCEYIKPVFAKTTEQAPTKIDFMTTFLGSSAFMINDKCHITSTYSLNEDKFIELFLSDGDSTKQEVINYINSNDARDAFIEDLRSSANPTIKNLAENNIVTFRSYYKYDGSLLQGYELKIGD